MQPSFADRAIGWGSASVGVLSGIGLSVLLAVLIVSICRQKHHETPVNNRCYAS